LVLPVFRYIVYMLLYCPTLYVFPCFVQLNEFIFDSFGVRQLVTSAYHLQTNGQDDRTNQTLKRALSKYTNDEQTDRDKQSVVCAHLLSQ